jgi:hypothetical protein
MADAAPKRSYPPHPPWRIHLMGAEQDLQDLAAQHSRGRTRVIHFQEEYFLEADVLNELSDYSRAVEKAQGILHIIGGLAKVRRLSALPVKAASVMWTDDNGNWVGRLPLPSVHYRIVLGTKHLLEGAIISEQILALAETDEVVRINLIDFLGERDFSRLRRITRAILLDLGKDIKSGTSEVVRLGWATLPECTWFRESANSGNNYNLGAHARRERPQNQKNPMSLAMAEEFVRNLLVRWITSKIVPPR